MRLRLKWNAREAVNESWPTRKEPGLKSNEKKTTTKEVEESIAVNGSTWWHPPPYRDLKEKRDGGKEKDAGTRHSKERKNERKRRRKSKKKKSELGKYKKEKEKPKITENERIWTKNLGESRHTTSSWSHFNVSVLSWLNGNRHTHTHTRRRRHLTQA